MKTGMKQHSLITEKATAKAVPDNAYRLVKTDDLTEEACRRAFDTRWIGRYLEIWDSIDSTNKRVRQLGEENADAGALIIAKSQTAGKGRRGRSWEAPADSALLFSLLLRPLCHPERVSMVTLVTALAVSAALDEAVGIQTQIKWPNDIVHDKKKLCGILTEMSMQGEQICYVAVGIGINVTMDQFPEELSDKATSLYLDTGKIFDRSKILALTLKHFEEYYALFEETEDLTRLKDEYESRLAGKDSQVVLIENDEKRCGICRGITDMGALRVEYADGSIEEVISGEVSVRGIYGYI